MRINVEKVKLRNEKETFRRIFGAGVRTYAQTRLHAYCSKYVPMDSGMLDQSVDITPDFVEYRQPYAHYQWTGDVYGPNIPIYEDGVFVGFRSPKNKSKHPTGEKLEYSGDRHPLATSHWEEAAMAAHKEDLIRDIEKYLKGK